MSNISTTLPTRVSSGFWAKISDPAIQGALWKVLSCLCFSGINGVVHYFADTAGPDSPKIFAAELAFFETFFGFFMILPWVISTKASLRTTEYKNYIFRAIAASMGIVLWFSALSEMPIIQVVAFKYTGPFFTLLGAKIFLHERIGLARSLAIGTALAGAMIINIMGNELLSGNVDWADVGLMALMPLGATACYAGSAIFGKKLSKVDAPQTICFYLLLITMPILLISSLPTWVTPQLWQWPWLVFMGALLALAYYALSHAYIVADLTYLMPLSFTRLVAGALIGMFFFEEWPTVWTWVGSTLIIIASVTLCNKEIQHKKQKRAKKMAAAEESLARAA